MNAKSCGRNLSSRILAGLSLLESSDLTPPLSVRLGFLVARPDIQLRRRLPVHLAITELEAVVKDIREIVALVEKEEGVEA